MRIQHPKSIVALIMLIVAYVAVCKAAMGATINLAAGTFSPIQFSSGNTYVGVAGKTFIKDTRTADNTYVAEARNLADVAFQDIVFQGNATYWENCQRLSFVRVGFIDARRGRGNHQATFLQGVKNATFINCFWRNDIQAIQAYNSSFITFEGCVFESCGYGAKHSMNNSSDLVYRRCLFRRIRTFGIEIQNDLPSINNVLVEDCAFVDPEMFDNDSLNDHGMAASLPMAAATNVIVRRNYIDGYAWLLKDDGRPLSDAQGKQLRRAPRKAGTGVAGWKGWRVGCEVGGTKPVYTQNWIIRVNDPGAITTSTGAQCYDNRAEACLEAFDFAAPANGVAAAKVGSRVENNNDQVALPEHGGWDLVGVIPPKIIGGAAAPGFALTAAAAGDSTISFSAANIPTGASTIRIESISTVGRETGEKVGPQGAAALLAASQAAPIALGGFHPGWKIDVRGVALSGAGATLATSPWVTVQMPGDPTVAWPVGSTPTTGPAEPTIAELQAKIIELQRQIATLTAAGQADAAKIAALEADLAAARSRLSQIHDLSSP